jgi:hypothetical protein
MMAPRREHRIASTVFSSIVQPSRLGTTGTDVLREEPVPSGRTDSRCGTTPAWGVNVARFALADIGDDWDRRLGTAHVRPRSGRLAESVEREGERTHVERPTGIDILVWPRRSRPRGPFAPRTATA